LRPRRQHTHSDPATQRKPNLRRRPLRASGAAARPPLHLAVERHVSASTQNQALGALLFLYRDLLPIDLGPSDAVRARRSRRLPVVLSRDEVRQLLSAIDALDTTEPYGLMARLLYEAGLRLMECCRRGPAGVLGPLDSLVSSRA
jgi:integrase